MMLKEYLNNLKKLIAITPEIIEFEILRDSLLETDLETILLYRIKIVFNDKSKLELTERIIENSKFILRTKYSYHYQDSNGLFIKRWDNAPHHNELSTFPHHIHISDSKVIDGHDISGIEIVEDILKTMS